MKRAGSAGHRVRTIPFSLWVLLTAVALLARAPLEFQFPADHGPHPAYRIEWWYITANLQAADGTDYGVQWTLFRSALAVL